MLIPGYISLLIGLIVYLILLINMTSNNDLENTQTLVAIYVIFTILLGAGVMFALFSMIKRIGGKIEGGLLFLSQSLQSQGLNVIIQHKRRVSFPSFVNYQNVEVFSTNIY